MVIGGVRTDRCKPCWTCPTLRWAEVPSGHGRLGPGKSPTPATSRARKGPVKHHGRSPTDAQWAGPCSGELVLPHGHKSRWPTAALQHARPERSWRSKTVPASGHKQTRLPRGTGRMRKHAGRVIRTDARNRPLGAKRPRAASAPAEWKQRLASWDEAVGASCQTGRVAYLLSPRRRNAAEGVRPRGAGGRSSRRIGQVGIEPADSRGRLGTAPSARFPRPGPRPCRGSCAARLAKTRAVAHGRTSSY